MGNILEVTAVAILHETNVNIVTLKYCIPHTQKQGMENFPAQHKTLQGGAILMLVRHMGELLCSFSPSGGLESSLFTMF